MEELKLGKIFGIQVNMHISFIFLIFLFAIFGVLPLLFLLLLFSCVLLHELAHSIVGRNNGLHINKILLLPLGGLSEIRENEIPTDVEIKVAFAGPLFNLFLAFLSASFAAIASFPFNMFFQYLFGVNILLGVSNLIPAFPFDGGKVFRGLLAKKLSFKDATELTKKLGDFIIIIVFLISLAWGYVQKDISIFAWNLLIIVMVFEAGSYEVEAANMRIELSGLSAKDAIEKNFVILSENEKVEKAIKFLKKHFYVITRMKNSFYILDFSLLKNKKQRIGEVVKELPIVSANTKLFDALQDLKESGVIGVVSKGRLIGLVTPLSLKLIRIKRSEIKNKKSKM